MSDDKERDKLRKKEEKELRDSQDKVKSILASSYVQINENAKLIKRYTPVVGVGAFICTGCIIDSAKNIIGVENPDILGIPAHNNDSEELTDIAFGCLIKIIEASKPTTKFFIVNPENLQENKAEGVLFLGVLLSDMKDEETRTEFFERVKHELMNLGLMKNKLDEDMTEEEIQHHEDFFKIDYLVDVCINFTEQANEDEMDDLDIGFDEGFDAGSDEYHYRMQVALYKMYKGKKVRNLYKFLDDLHNTLFGLDEDEFKRYSKAFQKYIKKEKKKEIEGDE